MEKIHRSKAFLKCGVARYSSHLIINYGSAITTGKMDHNSKGLPPYGCDFFKKIVAVL